MNQNANTESKIEMVITSRERDIGGFTVRRILPYASHRMVGPFIFFDHMGPAEFAAGHGMDVRPHPHINLATVTYLFEGVIQHRDSLGSNQLIKPGDINWMTAGRGIVHSERTPDAQRQSGSRMNGIQLWVALPEEHEETKPTFVHHPKATLPEFEVNSVRFKLLLGRVLDHESPVELLSDLFYLDSHFPKGSRFTIPVNGRDAAAYVVSGRVRVCEQEVGECSMAVARSGEDLEIEALEDARLMILGGTPVGARKIFWNFVSSSQDRINQAKAEWAKGPRAESPRFHPIPDDNREFIPLPEEPKQNPKGTIM